MNKKSTLFKIVVTAVLVALNIVLERFLAFQFQNNHYNLSIITIGFAAVFLGMPYSIAVAGLGDLIGALLFPFGPYFPGYTFTNIIIAIIISICISKRANIFTISAATILNKALCTLCLNSLWTSILYKGGVDAFPAYMVTRIPQAIIMGVIDILALTVLFSNKSKIRILIQKAINKYI